MPVSEALLSLPGAFEQVTAPPTTHLGFLFYDMKMETVLYIQTSICKAPKSIPDKSYRVTKPF